MSRDDNGVDRCLYFSAHADLNDCMFVTFDPVRRLLETFARIVGVVNELHITYNTVREQKSP